MTREPGGLWGARLGQGPVRPIRTATVVVITCTVVQILHCRKCATLTQYSSGTLVMNIEGTLANYGVYYNMVKVTELSCA